MKFWGENSKISRIARMFGKKVEPMFQAEPPDESFLKQCKGRVLNIDGEKVVIETIAGNRFKPKYFEINGTHLISMLRFYAQMYGASDITEEQFRQFEEMEFQVEPNTKNAS